MTIPKIKLELQVINQLTSGHYEWVNPEQSSYQNVTFLVLFKLLVYFLLKNVEILYTS